MESSINELNINNTYNVIEYKGKGASCLVFLVEKRDTKKQYAGKVLNEKTPEYQNEIDILNKLSDSKNPYIVNLIDCGEGPVKLFDSESEETRQYLILDYASKREIYEYLYYPGGFQERHAKFIFSKILEGVQKCHTAGICHLDLKLKNILFDENFNPKICDFGFASEIKGKDGSGLLKEYLGTPNYACPEMHLRTPYNGVKADIFSLGVILFYLVTGKTGFDKAAYGDERYEKIILENFNNFWDKIEETIGEVPEQLKDLYQKMISWEPDERPSIQEIFDHPWMKEVKDLKKNEKEYKKLEEEVIKNLKDRYQKIIDSNGEAEANNDNYVDMGENRSLGEEENVYFSDDLNPRYYEKTGLNMRNYMKIVGKLSPVKFMNLLANKILEEYSNRCTIEENKKDLKFKAILEKKENEEKKEKLNEEVKKIIEERLNKLGIKMNGDFQDPIKPKDSVIEIILLVSKSQEYLIQFEKNGGEIEDYIQNLEVIKKIIKEII